MITARRCAARRAYLRRAGPEVDALEAGVTREVLVGEKDALVDLGAQDVRVEELKVAGWIQVSRRDGSSP